MQRVRKALIVLVLVDIEVAEIIVFFIVDQNAGIIVRIVVIIAVIDPVFTETVGKVVAQARRVIIVVIVVIVAGRLAGERFGIDFQRIIRLFAIAVLIVRFRRLFRRFILFGGFKLGLQTRIIALGVELGPALWTSGRPTSEVIEFRAAAGAGALASQFLLGHGIPT